MDHVFQIDTWDLNDMQLKSMNKVLMACRNGGTVDIIVRKDAKETRVEADWLKLLKPKQL